MYDSKGFRILSNKDNLGYYFNADKYDNKEDRPGDSFEKLFKESETDRFQQYLFKEKMDAPERDKKKPLTPSEKIKIYPSPELELDLHGYTSVDAESAVDTFIKNAHEKKIRTVRLIVGKGLHSQGKAVLPDVVEKKIFRFKQENVVLGFNWEKKDKRKSGSLIVYLKVC
ncbi:MAG: Smr/MutS family protein [bacterium]|nr:Smr/MutS family protein [bacterium]